MKKSRTVNAIINSSVLATIQVITIFLKFLTQTIFIYYLGKTYLGLNGLFSNILSVLGFADLGIDTSIVYALYAPLAQQDRKKVAALMNFLHEAYIFIGVVIAVAGLIVIPFLPNLIKDYHAVAYIPFYYVLYLTNSVVSYFFTYKRSILIADQMEWVSATNQFIFMVIQTVLQVIVLFFIGSYSLYLAIQIVCTLASNIVISRRVDRKYTYLTKLKEERISKAEFRSIKHNVYGMIGSRLGSVVVRSTDNLLLSTFAGLGLVGIYSNYQLITTSVAGILNKLVSSVTATVGNLITERDEADVYHVFNTHFMVNFYLVSYTAACLLVAFDPFIKLWAGKTFLLSSFTVGVIVINYFVDQIRQTAITFVSAYGLFVPNGKKSVFEAIINLGLSSLLLVKFNLGVAGVLLGTTMTDLILNSWFEPWLIFSRGFRSLRKKFLKFYLFQYGLNLLMMLVFIFVVHFIIQNTIDVHITNLIVQTFVNLFVMVVILTVFIFIVYGRSESFKDLIGIFRKIPKLLKR